MERTPAYLAALASVAVPGLDPVTVEALPSLPEHLFDVAFVVDTQSRRWVVRAPRTPTAAAAMEQAFTLLGLLGRRLPFSVPQPKGYAAVPGAGRAAVYPYLSGELLDFTGLPAGPGPAAEIGRALAALHNTDSRLFEEAGSAVYDPDAYRSRRLADLDRAAGTGKVPAGLLSRWERALEDVALWRFAPTPVHGDLTGDQILVHLDGDDASDVRVKAVLGWEDAKVADPADDFASLVELASPEALDTVLEAYAHSRVERPDANLLVRARLASELNLLASLQSAHLRQDAAALDVLGTQLHRLDDEVHTSERSDDYRRTSLSPVPPRHRPAPPPPEDAVGEEDDDVHSPDHAHGTGDVPDTDGPAPDRPR